MIVFEGVEDQHFGSHCLYFDESKFIDYIFLKGVEYSLIDWLNVPHDKLNIDIEIRIMASQEGTNLFDRKTKL